MGQDEDDGGLWGRQNTIAPGRQSHGWCGRCNLSRVETPLYALTAAGVVRVGHTVDCGCYR